MTEPIPFWEDWRLLQIGAAFLGFFLAAWAKYGFDLRLDASRREQARIAVAVEVQAEMVALLVQAVGAKRLISSYRVSGRPMGIGNLVSFDLPEREFLRGAPGQLGVLGPDLCFEIARAHMWLANIRRSFAALRVHDSATPLDPGNLAVFETSFVGLGSACQSAIEALEVVTGESIPWKPPELDLPEPEATPE